MSEVTRESVDRQLDEDRAHLEADPPDERDEFADRTFTQAELDRIVQDRLKRERQKFEGFDDFKAKAAKFDEIESENQSELEKAQQAREKAEADAAKAIERANAQLIQAEVLRAATVAKAVKPEHLYHLINREQVTIGDDGQVTGAAEAVQEFLDANPEYVGTGKPKGDADQGARQGGAEQLSKEDVASMTPDQVRTAVREGRLSNVLAGG